MKINLNKYSYRFAEQVLNSNLSVKQEIEQVLINVSEDFNKLSRPQFNEILEKAFIGKGWESQPEKFMAGPKGNSRPFSLLMVSTSS